MGIIARIFFLAVGGFIAYQGNELLEMSTMATSDHMLYTWSGVVIGLIGLVIFFIALWSFTWLKKGLTIDPKLYGKRLHHP